jgi:hypothetical protein
MNRRSFLKLAAAGAFAASPVLKLAHAQDAAPDASAFLHPTLASSNREPVGLRLVCLFDNSVSMDEVEFEIQSKAMAEAVGSEDFRDAIFYPGGPQSIAICFADLNQKLWVPWMDVRKGDDHKLPRLAEEILKVTLRPIGPTYLGRAIKHSGVLLENCPWKGKRNVVDLITDGTEREWLHLGEPANNEMTASIVHELAVKHEATVNALITTGDRWAPNIVEWTPKYYVTQPGYTKADGTALDAGFVKIVSAGIDDTNTKESLIRFEGAMQMAFRRKLVLEVGLVELEDLRRHVGLQRGVNTLLSPRL